MNTENQPANLATDPRTAKLAALMYRPGMPPELMEARIRFAKKWRLKNRVHIHVPDPQTQSGEEWGKTEKFRDEDGRLVVLLHNYAFPPPKIMKMTPTTMLYGDDRPATWVGRYESMSEYRFRKEAANARRPKFGAARHLFTEPPQPRRKARKARGRLMT